MEYEEYKKIVAALLLVALAIGIVAGYANYNGKSTILLVCIIVGVAILGVVYYLIEKMGDISSGRKIGKF